uniref:Ribosomal protein S1 n=1 Tax=prasinophyte sp. MBIC10622 TaxID=156113 RepID=A0A650AKH3_9CHLO|nr:ribosomal protein S1 [prasinophyte sp. MBIC10622]
MNQHIQSFETLYKNSTASMQCLQGNVIVGKPLYTQGNHVYMDIGYKRPVCLMKDGFQYESCEPFPLRIVYLETPDGESVLESTEHSALPDMVWDELETYRENGKPIQGHLLNSVKGGQSIGIAGYVAFMPHSRYVEGATHYRILHMNAKTKNIVVGHYGHWADKTLRSKA